MFCLSGVDFFFFKGTITEMSLDTPLICRLSIWKIWQRIAAIITILNFFTPHTVLAETIDRKTGDVFEIVLSDNPLSEEVGVKKPKQVIAVKKEKPVKQIKKKITVKSVKKIEVKKTIRKTSIGGNTYGYGYCTFYVKQRLGWVPNLLGNANQWLMRAQQAGLKTGTVPVAGSVIVTSEGSIGHVAVVDKVVDNDVYISEMNYRDWNVVSSRVINKNNKKIKGYIYAR